jgi:hypothetical protein
VPDLDRLFDALREPTVRGDAHAARTRGDHLRRRRTAAAVVGSAVAVALVAGGVVWGLTDSARTSTDPVGPTPVPSPTAPGDPSGGAGTREPLPDARTRIPGGFPLDRGFPAVDADGERLGPAPDVEVFSEDLVCDGPVDFGFDPVRRLAVRQTMPEAPRQRLLMTFESEDAASEALSRVAAEYSRCPRQDQGNETFSLNRVTPDVLGDESYLVVRRQEMFGEIALGLRVLFAVRVGNALLLSTTDSEALGDAATVENEVEKAAGAVTALVEEMCVFSDNGC